MTPLDLSSDVGLVALWLLTANVLMGLLLSVRYNPWKHWPHRRFNYFRLHNWTGYIALALCILHPVLLLAVKSPAFRIVDLVYPPGGPRQPWINLLGALSLYALAFVVVTSYYRVEIGRGRWKLLHYAAYASAILFYIHGIFTDPTLKDAPIDYLDGEKVGVEVCALLVVLATALRVRWALRQRRTRPVMARTSRAA
ncbi:MAG TPA: ferric reductase-like transmembrane domain-containing protein [Gemmatimonadaceae bacterium]|nr:ferric reductase-like transmembrane domain-containing protein [Gemmatimonadaceae bacterium]